jgi:hypothetical protein
MPTIKELKAKLQAKGLPVSGTKSILEARLKSGVKSRTRKTVKSVKKLKSRKQRKQRKKPAVKPRTMTQLLSQKLSLAEIQSHLEGMTVTNIKKSPVYKSLSSADKKKMKKKADIVRILSGKIHSSKSIKSVKKSRVASRSRRPAACNWVLEFERKFSRDKLKSNPHKLYIFGENDECYETGQNWRKTGMNRGDETNKCYQRSTQAVIRGEPNAAPIVTVSRLGASDKKLKEYMKRDVDAILADVKQKDIKHVVLSDALVGTGVAALHNKKPDAWNYLVKQLFRLAPGVKLPVGKKNSPTSVIDVLSGGTCTFSKTSRPAPPVAPRKSRRVQPIKKKSITRSDIGTSNISELEAAIRECLFGKVAPAMTTTDDRPLVVTDEEEPEVDAGDDDDIGF